MKGRDFGIGLLGVAIVAATVTAVVVSGRDTSTPARAEDTTHELTTPVSPQGCGEVTAREPGETTVPSPASQWTFPHNAYVQVTARAHEGCTFSKWVLEFAGYPVEQTTNPTQFQLIEDMTATAHFTGTPASTTPTPTATAVPPPVTASCMWSTLGEDPVLNPGLKSDCDTLLEATSTLAGTATLNWSVDTPIADWDGVELDGTPRRVTSLVLKGKELTGSIPTSFESLAMLDTLALGRNQLTGAIPVELGNLASLTQLHLEQNQLTGSIPAELGNLTGLTYLSLGLNQLTGSIPSQLGNLTLLTHLVLDNSQLSGQIPTELGNLTQLREVYLSGNAFRGCLPAVFEDVATSDFETLDLLLCGRPLPYTIDITGAVTTSGSYSFMSEGDDGTMSTVTTYEGLRDGSTTALLIHKTDAEGTSRSDILDAVEAGDLVEWRKADDCFVRYKVLGVKPDPTGTIPMKALDVEWMTYAFTGCSGTITSSSSENFVWGEMNDLGGDSLQTPIVHGGMFQLTPGRDWEGQVQEATYHEDVVEHMEEVLIATTTETAQVQMRHWRTPTVPEGWELLEARRGGWGSITDGYCSWWVTDSQYSYITKSNRRYQAFELCARYASGLRHYGENASSGHSVRETRVIAGRPAIVLFSPLGPNHIWHSAIHVYVYDPELQVLYKLVGTEHLSLRGANISLPIQIMTSLFVEAGQEEEQMLARAFRFTYDTYDTTGAVTTAGSYAFLTEGDDGTMSTVTTYEGLRDGSTTALLIHKTDAEGISRSDILDAVEAGDLVEWRKADDCFVRYRVTEVKANPEGDTPRKAFGVEWLMYAFTGCYGMISTDFGVRLIWDELTTLGGDSLTAPVVVGFHQLVPRGWTGAVKEIEFHRPDEYSEPASLADASPGESPSFDLWREPNLPEGWKLIEASSGGVTNPSYGFNALYSGPRGGIGLELIGYFLGHRYEPTDAGLMAEGIITEARVIAGRPALYVYSPPGENQDIYHPTTVHIVDVATESGYTLRVYADDVLDAIELARSLFVEAGQEEEQMLARAFRFTYDTYDTTGAVTTAGSYAFLTEGEDGAMTAVTTYEALRDGTTTMLKIHTSDADDASQADAYDDVEAGHLIEWSQAGDCFVRYRVSDAPAFSEGATSREFGVRPETYAWQSCQTGSLPTSGSEDASGPAATAMTITVGTALPLEHLGGTNLTGFAVIHGPWQLTPYVQSQPGAVGSPSAGVAVKLPEYHKPTGQRRSLDEPVHTSDLTQAARLPYWRTLLWLPTGWTFKGAESGDKGGPLYGYCASWINAEGYEAAIICGYYADVRRDRYAATWLTNHDPPRRIVRELREIAGRPAWVDYSPLGSQHHPSGGVEVWIYDTATETVYEIQGADRNLRGANVEAVIRMACSLFWAPSECATP